METRYHCEFQMDYLGIKDKEHWFECQICRAREATLDPEKPTTPIEKPGKSQREYGSATLIGDKIFRK